ncbi:hypothetical protein [Streptomyces sp. NPDC005077]|uniref:hypothetical protein n=1 Tax=Streptomyces sp. NPDC005077 TaxID=3154292 RepID=UPI0033B86B8F
MAILESELEFMEPQERQGRSEIGRVRWRTSTWVYKRFDENHLRTLDEPALIKMIAAPDLWSDARTHILAVTAWPRHQVHAKLGEFTKGSEGVAVAGRLAVQEPGSALLTVPDGTPRHRPECPLKMVLTVCPVCEPVPSPPEALPAPHPGDIVGVLMLPLNRRFYRCSEFSDPRPRTIYDLGVSRQFAKKMKARYYEPPERLVVLAAVLSAVLDLHDLDICVNDLSPGNTCYGTELSDICLLDCDSMWGPWGHPTPPLAPNEYQHVDGVSAESDLIKFATMAINILQEDGWGPTAVDRDLLRRLMPETAVDVLASAMQGDIASAAEWRQLAATWARGIRPDGRMFVSVGHGGIQQWNPGVTTWPPPRKAARRGPNARVDTKDPALIPPAFGPQPPVPGRDVLPIKPGQGIGLPGGRTIDRRTE